MRLNLGCGRDVREGWENVDISGPVRWDLNNKPWPWQADSVEEVLMHHVLEHLPDLPGVMKELYRVCKKDAVIHMALPHPFHEDWVADPTHVTRVLPRTIQAFSKKVNEENRAFANQAFGLDLDVDFEIVKSAYVVENRWISRLKEGQITADQLDDAILTFNNVVKQIEMDVKVLKC